MHPCILATLAATVFFAPPAAPQAPMDDAIWLAGRQTRTLTKLNRCGEVLQTVDLSTNGFDLRTVNRSPDGSLWLVNFITPTMTILDRNGANPRNIATSGNPSAIAFDAGGDAWVAMNNTGTVDRFSAAGTFVTSYNVGAGTFPLGIAIDSQGNAWVGHRTGPPSRVSHIDRTTGTVTPYTLPATTTTLGGNIVVDMPGLGLPQFVWTGGDSSNELVKLDTAGNVVGVFPVGTVSGITSLSVGADSSIWVTAGAFLFKVAQNGSVALTISNGPSPSYGFVDALGNPWTATRVDFSGAIPSEARRFHRDTGALEAVARVAGGSFGAGDAQGFQFAFVVDRFGDADGDGSANIAEVLGRSSPYDNQSTPSLHFDTRGAALVGGTADLVAASAGPGTFVTLLATAYGPDLPVPGVTGNFRLDPAGLLPFTIAFAAPGSLTLPIPNDPFLAGLVVRMQALFVGAPLALSNTGCIQVR